jgi:hypothetical protein
VHRIAAPAAAEIAWRREVRATLQSPVLRLRLATQQAGSIMLFCTFLGGAIGVPVWTWLGTRYEKPATLIALFA